METSILLDTLMKYGSSTTDQVILKSSQVIDWKLVYPFLFAYTCFLFCDTSFLFCDASFLFCDTCFLFCDVGFLFRDTSVLFSDRFLVLCLQIQQKEGPATPVYNLDGQENPRARRKVRKTGESGEPEGRSGIPVSQKEGQEDR